MSHPLTGKIFKYYLLMWAVIVIAHIFFLQYGHHFEFTIALSDSLIFNVLVAGFGMTYWYVVKFLQPRYSNTTNILISHLMGVSFVAAVITYFASFLLNRLFNLPEYILFLDDTILWRSVLVMLYMVIIIMIYYLLQYNSSLQNKLREEEQLQHMLRNSELEMLKFQLNPHFIFNSLNSISSLTITSPSHAQEMVIKLSEFLRSSLGRGGREEMYTLKEELRHMNLYLDIEKVRFGDRLILNNQINEKCLEAKVPHLILQPIFENAIKHGLYDQLEEVEIRTSCDFRDNTLYIEVSNNFDPDNRSLPGKGIGLKNVRKQLELIYNRDDLLSISNDNSNFVVTLTIPQDDQSNNN